MLSPQQAIPQCSAVLTWLLASGPLTLGSVYEPLETSCLCTTFLCGHSPPSTCPLGQHHAELACPNPSIPGTTPIGWAGAPAGWCYPREGGARRETSCLVPRESNCHNLATDESALPNPGWLPGAHGLWLSLNLVLPPICSQLTTGSGGALLRHTRPPSNALPDDISPTIT